MPLGYLGDEAKTRRTYPTIDGVRYAVPGDRAQLDDDGTHQVLGRDSVCINSGGEKIFAEEVEQALKRHPAVYDVLVTGTPSERWGEQVTAVVALRPGATRERRRAARRRRAPTSRATSCRAPSSSSTRCVRAPTRQARLRVGESGSAPPIGLSASAPRRAITRAPT